jgi:hypothetical protein
MRHFALALLLLLPISLCKAQSADAKPVEPKTIGVVYRLDLTSQELKPLLSEPWKQGKKGCGGTNFCFTVDLSGDHSAFRLKTGDTFEFVFKAGSPEKVSLYLFKVKKNNRWFDFEKWGQGRNEPIKGLPVEITQYGTSSYKLVPTSPLTPGEYAITIAGEVYTFGIDQ